MEKSINYVRELESNFHRELAGVCRKYQRDIGIVSVLGMLELVKQETIELESATKRNIDYDKSNFENKDLQKL